MEWNRFAWREAASIGAATSYLAEELKESQQTMLCKQDRECIARMMIKCESGNADTGCPNGIEWKHDDNPSKDVLWRLTCC